MGEMLKGWTKAKGLGGKTVRDGWIPARGDRVRYVFDDTDEWGEGVIIAEGPEISTWRCDADRQERHRSNRDFELVEAAKEGARVTTAPRSAPRKILEASKYEASSVMRRAKAGNPKKDGSAAHGRWALMLSHCDQGSTVGQFLSNGGNPETLANGVQQGYAKVEEK